MHQLEQGQPDIQNEGSDNDDTELDQEAVTTSSLLHDRALQKRVRARLADLQADAEDSDESLSDTRAVATASRSAGKHSKWSGRAKRADEVTVREIDWPHFYIFR